MKLILYINLENFKVKTS